jgi:ribosome-associated translation inhibitor RaiA
MKTDTKTSGFEPSPDFKKYSKHKLGEVVRRIPRSSRETAVCALKCMQRKGAEGDVTKTCRLVVTFGGQEFRAKETTQHMYAALDIVTADMILQIKAYRRQLRARQDTAPDH